MKIQDLIENEEEHQGDHTYPQEVWNFMVGVLRQNAERLKNKAQGDTSHSRGGNISQSSSGAVKVEQNWRQHSTYGGSTTWNFALQVGTNIQGGGTAALAAVKEAFTEMVEGLKEYRDESINIEIVNQQQDFFSLKVDDRQFNVSYNYASNYCWVAIRVAR